MARFGINDADKYGGQGGGGFFSLKNDKDTARVRFLYDSIDDVEGVAVHEIKVGDKKRYVECIREYGQPLDTCPFCAEKHPAVKSYVQAKYFIPLYDITSQRIITWERGKKFGGRLSTLCSRYPHLVSHVFEIERNGKAGSTDTTYEIFEVGEDPDVQLSDFDVKEEQGEVFLTKTAEDMEYFLQNDCFPDDEDAAPIRRGSDSGDRSYSGNSRGYANNSGYDRRTPNQGRRDRY